MLFLNKHLFQPEANQQYPKPDVWMQITIPSEFMPQGHYNIGVTAGIESTLAPADWVEGCNRMDMILGSSKHTIDAVGNAYYCVQEIIDKCIKYPNSHFNGD